LTDCAVRIGATVLVIATVSGNASADPRAPVSLSRVSLSIEGCPPATGAGIRRVARAELGAMLASVGLEAADDADRVSIRCRDEVAEIVASSPRRATRLDRLVDVAAFAPAVRARVMALSAIELLAALSPEVRRQLETRPPPELPPAYIPAQPRAWPAPPPANEPATPRALPPSQPSSARPAPPPPPPPPPPPRPAAQAERVVVPPHTGAAERVSAGSPGPVPRTPPAWRLMGLVARRKFSGGGVGLDTWGGAFSAERRLRRPLAVVTELALDFDRRPVAAGDVVATNGSFGAALLATTSGSRLAGQLGAGLRVGLVNLQGVTIDSSDSSFQGRSALLPWAGPLLTARLLGSAGRLSLVLGVEAGWTVLRASGTQIDQVVVSISGPWVGLSAGLALNL
jgi:hypothetical protein